MFDGRGHGRRVGAISPALHTIHTIQYTPRTMYKYNMYIVHTYSVPSILQSTVYYGTLLHVSVRLFERCLHTYPTTTTPTMSTVYHTVIRCPCRYSVTMCRVRVNTSIRYNTIQYVHTIYTHCMSDKQNGWGKKQGGMQVILLTSCVMF